MTSKGRRLYGNTLGLRRSVWMPDRNFAEFETGNLTLSLMNAEEMGLGHTSSATRSRSVWVTWPRRERPSRVVA